MLWHRDNKTSRKIDAVPGMGPIAATALVATIGDGPCFKNGRQMAAWLGIVPKQRSSEDKQALLGISKRVDVYLRTLLIRGARAVIRYAEHKTDQTNIWLNGLLSRRNKNVATVALANNNVRIA